METLTSSDETWFTSFFNRSRTSAEDRTQSSYWGSLPGIGNLPSIDDITSYTQSLKSMTVGRNNRNCLAPDTVTYVKFDTYTIHNVTHQFLIIGTSTGFQVFLIHDVKDFNNGNNSPKDSPHSNSFKPKTVIFLSLPSIKLLLFSHIL